MHQWLNEKDHQFKLQMVTITTCASRMVSPVDRRKTLQAQGAKVRTQSANVRANISVIVGTGCSSDKPLQQPLPPTRSQPRTSTAISACNLCKYPPFPYKPIAIYIALCTLHLCYIPSINWCKPSTCTRGDWHQLQVALVVLVPQPLMQINIPLDIYTHNSFSQIK